MGCLNMPEEKRGRCKVIEREDLVSDERFQDIRGRFQHMPEIVAAIDEALSQNRDEWGEIFDSEGIIWVRYWAFMR